MTALLLHLFRIALLTLIIGGLGCLVVDAVHRAQTNFQALVHSGSK